MKDFYVYVLFRPWDGSPFYVGKGRRGRIFVHKKRRQNRHVRNIFEKADRLGLEIPTIKIRSGLDESTAFSVEIALIAALGRSDLGLGCLANQTDGGEGSSNPSVTTTEKRVRNLRGKSRPLSVRLKISAALKGHQVSKESRDKISIRSKAIWSDPEKRPALCKASKDRNYSPSPEVREKVGKFHRGRKRSAETRAKLSAAAKARYAKADIPHQH